MNSTIKAYDEGNFLDWRTKKEEDRKIKNEPTFWKDEMDRFLEYVSTGDIIEIGPGIGVEAEYLLTNGNFDSYTGVEPALSLANYCRDMLSGLELGGKTKISVIAEPVEKLQIPKRFDAVVAVCSLIHVTFITDALTKMRDLCKDRAYGWIVMLENEQEGWVRVSDRGYTYYFYEVTEFVNYLFETGFEVLRDSVMVTRGGHTYQNYFVRAT